MTTEFEQAVVLYQQGRVTEAERLCHAVLRSVPEHYQALHLLGVLALARRDVAAGANWIARSLRLNASQPLAYSNLGAALLDLGRSEEALRNLDRALALMPDFPEAVNNRGNALLVLRRVDEALATYERAIALRPDYADALNNRGNALKELGRVGEALAAYEQALRIHPEFPAALVNRGNALSALGRGAEAIAAFEAALRLDARNVDALNGLGTALRALDRPLEALAAYERALQVAPALAKLHYNRGNALLQLQQAEEALASYERALQLDPGDVDALCNRGNALRDLRRLPEALASYEAVLGLDPGNADALSNRGTVLLELKEYEAAAAAFRRLLELAPDYPYAPGHHLQAQLNCCDWSDYAASVARVRAGVAAGRPVIVPFSFLAVADSPAAELSCVRRFVADGFAGPPAAAWRAPPHAHQRIRLAYLSSNFRSHALAYLMAELFERHDRARFEVTAVSYGPDDGSAMRARLQRAFDYFHDVRTLGDAAVAELLRRSEIDIAVDLNGFTTDARTAILARRAAPVQVSYLGFPGTMGGSQIDYLIADRHVIPPAERVHYAEQVVYLPDCYFVHPAEREVAERSPSRRESGLPDNSFVFCCFNNNYKITPPVFRVWMRLLREAPGSVLWLLQDNEAAARNLKSEAAACGVAPERLVFAPRLPQAEHLARHRLADLCLDTLPVNAHTTAIDALAMDLPLLTCIGSTFAGRVAASMLRAAGLHDLVAENLEQYTARAHELASTPARLAAMRAQLRRSRGASALFDADRFRGHMEAAYVEMCGRSRRGEPPASFGIEA